MAKAAKTRSADLIERNLLSEVAPHNLVTNLKWLREAHQGHSDECPELIVLFPAVLKICQARSRKAPKARKVLPCGHLENFKN